VKIIDYNALRQAAVSCWDELNRPAVTARVLTTIRKRLAKQIGREAQASPAAIARILADEGAELRHPEIIESDAAWRHKVLSEETKEFAQIQRASEQGTDLEAAEELLRSFETSRRKFEGEQNQDKLAQLKSLAIQARQAATSISENAKDENLRLTQSEIVVWLKVWLQTPNLFNDWLELRKRSQEFRAKFPNYSA
jgi:hypothetical protein